MPYSDQDLDALTRMVYGEAGGPSEYFPVASTLINRAAKSGGSLSSEFAAPGQYESYGAKRVWDLSPDSPTYKNIRSSLEPLVSGAVDPDPYTHFYAPKLQYDLGRRPPSWDNGTGVDIGKSRFFTLPYGGSGSSRMALGGPPSLASTLQGGSPMPGFYGSDVPDFYDDLEIKAALQRAQQFRNTPLGGGEGTLFGALAKALNAYNANYAERGGLDMVRANSQQERDLLRQYNQIENPVAAGVTSPGAAPAPAPAASPPAPRPIPGVSVAGGVTPENPAGTSATTPTYTPAAPAPAAGAAPATRVPGATPSISDPRDAFTKKPDILDTEQAQRRRMVMLMLAQRNSPIGQLARDDIKFEQQKSLQLGMITQQKQAELQMQREMAYDKAEQQVIQGMSAPGTTEEQRQQAMQYLQLLRYMRNNGTAPISTGAAAAPASAAPAAPAAPTGPTPMPGIAAGITPGAATGAAPAALPSTPTPGMAMPGINTRGPSGAAPNPAAAGFAGPPAGATPAPDASPAPGEPKTEDEIQARDLKEMQELARIRPSGNYNPKARWSPQAQLLDEQAAWYDRVGNPEKAKELREQLKMDPSVQQAQKFSEKAGEENAKFFSDTKAGMIGSMATWGQQKQNFQLIRDLLADPDHGLATGVLTPVQIAAQRALSQLGIKPEAAAHSETLNMALARVMAEQVASLRTFAKSAGGDMGRVFAKMIDLEEAALPNIHDTTEGILQKINILDNAGSLMIRWGKYANAYAYNNGGSLDERFIDWIHGKIENARLPLKNLEDAAAGFEHRGSKGDAEKILKGEVPGKGAAAPKLMKNPAGVIAEEVSPGKFDTDTPAAKAAQAKEKASVIPQLPQGRSGVPEGAQLQPQNWIELLKKTFGTTDPEQIARQRKRAGLPPLPQPLPPT